MHACPPCTGLHTVDVQVRGEGGSGSTFCKWLRRAGRTPVRVQSLWPGNKALLLHMDKSDAEKLVMLGPCFLPSILRHAWPTCTQHVAVCCIHTHDDVDAAIHAMDHLQRSSESCSEDAGTVAPNASDLQAACIPPMSSVPCTTSAVCVHHTARMPPNLALVPVAFATLQLRMYGRHGCEARVIALRVVAPSGGAVLGTVRVKVRGP